MREISANWFSRKLDFSISVFCAVSAETKLETETFYRDAFAVVVLKRGNHEKKRGSCGSRFTNLDKISTSADGLFCMFCRFLRKRSSKWFCGGGGWVQHCFERSHAST